jgi:hypothetical protein
MIQPIQFRAVSSQPWLESAGPAARILARFKSHGVQEGLGRFNFRSGQEDPPSSPRKIPTGK